MVGIESDNHSLIFQASLWHGQEWKTRLQEVKRFALVQQVYKWPHWDENRGWLRSSRTSHAASLPTVGARKRSKIIIPLALRQDAHWKEKSQQHEGEGNWRDVAGTVYCLCKNITLQPSLISLLIPGAEGTALLCGGWTQPLFYDVPPTPPHLVTKRRGLL